MPAQKKTPGSLLGGLIGVLGLSALAGVLVTAMVAPAIAVTGMTAKTSIDIFDNLPSYITLGQLRQQNQIYLKDASGNPFLVATIYDQNRQEIPLDQMGTQLQNAAIAGEDRRFYTHGGVDLQSLVRAAIGQAGGSEGAGGASTIAMQTVRNIKVQQIVNDPKLSTDQKEKQLNEEYTSDLGRKLQEMRLAISLEKKYSKKTILQGYLNIANFGGNTYGVAAAAKQYFSKAPADLTAAEAASIIAIVQNPSTRGLNNPANYKNNQERRDQILADMHQVGYLNDADYQTAIKTPVDANFIHYTAPTSGCRYADQNYALFCDYIVKSVPYMSSLGSTKAERIANFASGGYKFYGTLDTTSQQVARATVQKYAPPTETRFYLGAAEATVEPGTGRILTMSQNYNFDDATPPTTPNSLAINLAAGQTEVSDGSSGYQPGSTYKAFTLMAYLQAGNALQASFNGAVLSIPYSKFKSCDGGFGGGSYGFKNDSTSDNRGWSVLTGTAQSVNSVFLQMATKVDQCSIRNIAQSFGMTNSAVSNGEMSDYPSCAIGVCNNNTNPLMVAAAYAGIAAQGKYCKPIAVDQIIAPNGAKLPGQNADCTQAIDPNIANSAAYALQGVFKPGGTAYQGGSNPNDGTPYLGKTGTTDRAFHVWTTGSSTAASTSVWVGNWKAKSTNIVNGGPDDQNLRAIYVGGVQAALLRHRIFEPIAAQLDKTHKGVAFPAPDPNLLKGKPVLVPDVTGGSVTDAQNLLDQYNLSFADGGQIDSTEPAGQVVSSDPAAGTSVSVGTTVTVFESNGQGISMPDVSSGKNLTYQQATQQLQQSGFTQFTQQCQQGGNPGDQQVVVGQNPPAGSTTDKNQAITLTVQKNVCT